MCAAAWWDGLEEECRRSRRRGLCVVLLVLAAALSPAEELSGIKDDLSKEEKDCIDKWLSKASSSVSRPTCDSFRLRFNSSTPRVTAAAVLHACVGTGADANRALRVVVYKSAMFTLFKNISDTTYGAGSPITFVELDQLQYVVQRDKLIRNTAPPNATYGYDALIVTPTALGEAASIPYKLLDIGPIDPVLESWRINKHFREAHAMYGNKVVGIPLAVTVYFTYYDRELFERYNLTVPQTWEEFADLAERYNNKDTDGDGVPDLIGACLRPKECGTADAVTLRAIYASYVQTAGHSQGIWWDAVTMKSLVGSRAMAAALEILRRIRAAGPRTPGGCWFEVQEYCQKRCLLSFASMQTFKACSRGSTLGTYSNQTAIKGRMGMALMPGSARVLNRKTGDLEYCTPRSCPKAQDTVNVEGVGPVLVNRPIMTTSALAIFNRMSPPSYQFYAFSLFAYLASPMVLGSKEMLMGKSEAAPMRADDVDATNTPMWVAEGYDGGDTDLYLAAYRLTWMSENLNPDPKFPGASRLVIALANASNTYTGNTSSTTRQQVVLDYLSGELEGIVRANGDGGAFPDVYRSSLNWDGPMEPDGGGLFGLSPGATAAAIGTPLALASAVTLVLLWLYRRRHQLALAACMAPPGAGPGTTLLVTDIQDSTALWEHSGLPADILDSCMNMHHNCIRRLFTQYRAYESATEGDSFLLAFRCPEDALGFAMAAQQALLVAPWPAALLERAGCFGVPIEADPVAEVYVVCRSPHQQQQQAANAAIQRMGSGALPLPTSQSAPPHPSSAGGGCVDPPPSGHVGGAQSSYSSPPAQHESSQRLQHQGDSHLRDAPAAAAAAAAPAGHSASGCAAGDDPNVDRFSPSTEGGTAASGGGVVLAPSRGLAKFASTKLLVRELHEALSYRPPFGAAAVGGAAAVSASWTLLQRLSEHWVGVSKATEAALRASGGKDTKAVLVFRGLRVRMGIHSGVTSASDISRNAASNRLQFSGLPLQLAKAVADAGHGGMVLLSEAARARLPPEYVREARLLLLWRGYHLLRDDLPAVHVYECCHPHLAPRIALVTRPLRVNGTLLQGLAQAQVAHGSVVQLSVVGASILLAWNYDVASRALRLLHQHLLEQLAAPGCDCTVVEGAVGLVEGGASSAGAGAGGIMPTGSGTGAVGTVGCHGNGALVHPGGPGSRDPAGAVDALSAQPSGTGSNGLLVAGDSGPQLQLAVLRGPLELGHVDGPTGHTSQHHPRPGGVGLGLSLDCGAPGSCSAAAATMAAAAGVAVAVSSPRHGNAHGTSHSLDGAGGISAVRSPQPVLGGACASSSSAIGRRRTIVGAVNSLRASRNGRVDTDDYSPYSSGARPGVLTVVFASVEVAADWALSCLHSMPYLPWPSELTSHELCESIIVMEDPLLQRMARGMSGISGAGAGPRSATVRSRERSIAASSRDGSRPTPAPGTADNSRAGSGPIRAVPLPPARVTSPGNHVFLTQPQQPQQPQEYGRHLSAAYSGPVPGQQQQQRYRVRSQLTEPSTSDGPGKGAVASPPASSSVRSSMEPAGLLAVREALRSPRSADRPAAAASSTAMMVPTTAAAAAATTTSATSAGGFDWSGLEMQSAEAASCTAVDAVASRDDDGDGDDDHNSGPYSAPLPEPLAAAAACPPGTGPGGLLLGQGQGLPTALSLGLADAPLPLVLGPVQPVSVLQRARVAVAVPDGMAEINAALAASSGLPSTSATAVLFSSSQPQQLAAALAVAASSLDNRARGASAARQPAAAGVAMAQTQQHPRHAGFGALDPIAAGCSLASAAVLDNDTSTTAPTVTVAFSGLRARCALVAGELRGELQPGNSSGQLTYRGPAWQQLGKLAKTAKAGQVVTTPGTAQLLPAELRSRLVVVGRTGIIAE